ncbi:hypothetical protein R1flu_001009 [Riccia fluitans]|uniref:Uncharacterized protein n=1 Tax=Riccia fluitans TaxID=41844 RepID=A0ABD1Y224_9MARC
MVLQNRLRRVNTRRLRTGSQNVPAASYVPMRLYVKFSRAIQTTRILKWSEPGDEDHDSTAQVGKEIYNLGRLYSQVLHGWCWQQIRRWSVRLVKAKEFDRSGFTVSDIRLDPPSISGHN